MPLHDWNDDSWWENFHAFWVVRLAEGLRPVLPDGYRVYIGSYSRSGLAMRAKPEVGVAGRPPATPPDSYPADPDEEVVVTTLEPLKVLYVQHRGAIVSAIEVVSPSNKDRPHEREDTAVRYAGYLAGGIHLMMIDLLPRPAGYSLADDIAARVGLPNQPPVPPPAVTVYRVSPAGVGSRVAVWRRPLTVGQPLPTLPLPLAPSLQVPVDLEGTYMKAAADAYLA